MNLVTACKNKCLRPHLIHQLFVSRMLFGINKGVNIPGDIGFRNTCKFGRRFLLKLQPYFSAANNPVIDRMCRGI
jgi:hypothetical protein